MMPRLLITTLCLLGILLTATPVMAAGPGWWPLVPCGLNAQPKDSNGIELPKTGENGYDYTQPCNRCHLFQLVKNLIDFVFKALMPIVATLLFVIAGFHIVLAGGNLSSVARGKQIFWDTAMAILVLSISWLLANTLIRSLAKDGVVGNWWEFQCRATVKPPTVPVGIPQPVQPYVPSTGAINACELCSAYGAAVIKNGPILAGGQPPVCTGDYIKLGIQLNSPTTTCDYATSAMANKLEALRSKNNQWVISEGFPPTINHSSSAHGNGTAVDIAMRPAMASTPTKADVERLAAICAAAKQAGFSTILNEYTNIPANLYSSLGECLHPRKFENTNGPHLHLQL